MKMHALGVLLVTLGAMLPQGEPETAQLEERLATASGRERVNLLNDLAQAKLRNAPLDAARLADEALVLAEQLEDGPGRIRALGHLGVSHYYLGEYDRALQLNEARLSLAQELEDDETITSALNDIGVIYYVWGEHDRALEYYGRALELWRQNDDRHGMATGNNNLANVYHTAKRYEKALEHLERALALYREAGDAAQVASVLNNIALSQYELGLLDEALESLEQALEIVERLDDRPGIAASLNNFGMVYGELEQHHESMDYYLRSLEVREELGDRSGVAVCISNIGSSYANLGEIDEALSYLNQGLALIRELNVREIERDIHLKLTEAYETKGDYESALESYRQYDAIDNDLTSESTARRLADLENRYQLEQKDREIEMLRRDQRLQRTLRNTFVGGASLLLVLVILLYNRYRLKVQANVALEEAQTEREKMIRTELSHVKVGELGTALAHELNQPLTAILTNAQATRRLLASGRADPAELDEALADIVAGSGRAREIIRRQRELLQRGELVREVLDINETFKAVERLARTDAGRDGATLSMQLAPGLPLIQGDRIQLQQVLLNLVHNAAEAMAEGDTGPRDIQVRTALEDVDTIVVSVSDTGPPVTDEVIEQITTPFFTTKPHGLGMGLPICQTIVEAHGGRLWVTRNSERGLTVRLTLPGSHVG